MNVVFLDFDGVINTPIWHKDENGIWDCDYNHPSDGFLNNVQAIQWVSEFCEKYDYHIVVSSSWRTMIDYRKFLYDSGLRDDILVLGNTPRLYSERGDEITAWLKENPNVKNYLIFDDDTDMTEHISRLVKCNQAVGFTMDSFNYAVSLHKAFNEGEE